MGSIRAHRQGRTILIEKYSAFAPLYDLLSAEYPVYGAGRRRLIQLLELHAGDQVLDLGCGTGMNFPLLQSAVGPDGIIVGIDRSAHMLTQARKRATRHGWGNVILVQADATSMRGAEISELVVNAGGRTLSDVAIATYSLSLTTRWQQAWQNMRQLTQPDAQLGVLGMQNPTGLSTLLSPLARAVCCLGGSDTKAHPWTDVERDCMQVKAESAWGGHLQIRVGSNLPPTKKFRTLEPRSHHDG